MERTILLCQVILIQPPLLLSNLQSLLIGLCAGQKQAIYSRPLSSREDRLPQKAITSVFFPFFFLKNFGPSKCSCVYVVGGEKLLLYSFLVGQYVLEGLESMATYYRLASLEIIQPAIK